MSRDETLTEFRAEIPLPDETTARQIYARAIARGTRRLPRRRLTFAVAVAAIGAVVAALLVTTGQAPQRQHGIPPPSDPMALSFTRSGQAITSIAVTVNGSIADAALQLQIRRADASQQLEAMNGNSDIVFQEQVPMSNIASPASAPPGTVWLSTWSGTLSPSDWAGGCQGALYIYSVQAVIVPSGDSFDAEIDGRSEYDSRWFACS